MGGKSNDNSAMIKEQEDQAAEARAKETERQARIDEGLQSIAYAFEGTPVYSSYTYDVPGSTSTTTGAATTRQEQYKDPHTGANRTRTVQVPGAAQTVTTPASTQTGYTDTGTTSGGFDDAFYDTFRQSMLDYYMPQVDTQYGDAKDDLTYGLARAGTSKSSAAVDEAAKLAEQNELNRANVISTADTGAADLRSRVASERAAAEAQLYATEDPEVAANQALAAVKNISLAQPELTPLGSVFETALVGGANALTGYKNEKLYQDYGLKKSGTGTSIISGTA